MPVDFTIDNKAGLLIYTITGKHTVENIKLTFEKALKHPDYVQNIPAIWDLRQTDASNIHEKEVKDLARYFEIQSITNPGYKAALVASDDLAYGLSRMLEAYAFDVKSIIQVFRNFEEAKKWVL